MSDKPTMIKSIARYMEQEARNEAASAKRREKMTIQENHNRSPRKRSSLS